MTEEIRYPRYTIFVLNSQMIKLGLNYNLCVYQLKTNFRCQLQNTFRARS